MALLRIILFPFSLLYGLVTAVRNQLYDWGIFRSYAFDTPVIVVGNLSVGGTGKTPMVEYLVRLLSAHYKVAILSRGYRRKSKGFVLADATATVASLGDEPFQYHKKFPNVMVAVDADRVAGIRRLLALDRKPDVILLDDAYQHRRVKPGFAILLTTYAELYTDDFLLPTGHLREGRRGAHRANMVVVTKCPPDLTAEQREHIRRKLRLDEQQSVFFTYIDYDDDALSSEGLQSVAEIRKAPKVLVAGIAKPQPFFDFLSQASDRTLRFPDHHDFSPADLERIRESAAGRIVVTTEKDYMRLSGRLEGVPLWYVPMRTAFLKKQEKFERLVRAFVDGAIGS